MRMNCWCKYILITHALSFTIYLKKNVHEVDIFLHVNMRGKMNEKLLIHMTH